MLLVLCAMLAFAGCSPRHWRAQVAMLKAEEAYTKAYALRTKKAAPQAERLKYYREACDSFLKACHADPEVFTLYRIQTAFESCRWVGNTEGEDEFRNFEEEYAKKHPTEVEYGDAFPAMVE